MAGVVPRFSKIQQEKLDGAHCGREKDFSYSGAVRGDNLGVVCIIQRSNIRVDAGHGDSTALRHSIQDILSRSQ